MASSGLGRAGGRQRAALDAVLEQERDGDAVALRVDADVRGRRQSRRHRHEDEPGQRPRVYVWADLTSDQKRFYRMFAVDPYGYLGED